MVVAVAKMDAVSYSRDRFDEVTAAVGAAVRKSGLPPACARYVPVCARSGANVAARPAGGAGEPL
eukprot:52657-Chlamydomonas_euryale.AAC.1